MFGKKKSANIAKNRVLNSMTEDELKEKLNEEPEQVTTTAPELDSDIISLNDYIFGLEDLYDYFNVLSEEGTKSLKIIQFCDNLNKMIDSGEISYSKNLTLKELSLIIYQESANALNQDLTESKEELENVNSQIATIKSEKEALKSQIDQMGSDYDALVIENQNLISKDLELEKKLNDSKVDPEVTKELKDLKEQIAAKDAEIADLETKSTMLEENCEKYREELQSLQTSISENSMTQETITSLENSLAQAVADKETAEQELEKIKESYVEAATTAPGDTFLENKVKELAEELNAKKIECVKLNENIRDLQLQLKKKEREILDYVPNTELVKSLEENIAFLNKELMTSADENLSLAKANKQLTNQLTGQSIQINSLKNMNELLKKRTGVVEEEAEVKEEPKTDHINIAVFVGYKVYADISRFSTEKRKNVNSILNAVVSNIDKFTYNNVEQVFKEIFGEDFN